MELTDEEICMGDGDNEGNPYHAVAPPIYQTSLFTKPTFEAFAEDQVHENERHVYSRGTNPTVEVLEQKLAALERGEACKCFGSGMGAISSTWMTILRPGDHVLFLNHTYGPALQLIEHLSSFDIAYTVWTKDSDRSMEDCIQRNTALIYMENPGTMTMEIIDIEQAVAMAREHSITTMMDNTWATPLFQKPLTMGVDIVVHSLTKYIGGHSDVLGGAVIASRAFIKKLFFHGYQLFGSVLSAMEASMVIRGLRTLPLRMRNHESNASQVLSFLQTRPEIKAIHHPSVNEEASVLVDQQFYGLSGLLSFELKDGGFENVARFINELRLFRIGTSWGGFESLVTSPVKPGNEEALLRQGFDRGLIRLSVGLEGAPQQIQDLEGAFERTRHYVQ